MVTKGDGASHRPFGEFRVTTEPMPDGRQIHYYEWPGGDEPSATDATHRQGEARPDEDAGERGDE